jgi:NAD(P)-dependent dehydrogenase (short-subunit alcohol dehydrogenase family)
MAPVDDAQQFRGRVVLVTGASRGIGRAIARAFANEGAGVALLSTSADGVKRVADEIAAVGGRVLPLQGDVASEADVRRFVAQAERALGPIDVLVNNAGIPGPTAPVTDIALADWERVLDVNLTGVFLCSREVLKGMMARRGTSAAQPTPGQAQQPNSAGAIINIGSIAGKISYPQRTPYASAKWALIGLTLSLAEELGPYGIRVNCICPGPVAGELLEEVIAARARSMRLPVEAVRQKYIGITMLKRLVRPEDVAAAALFLASDAAASITGQALDVSGGLASLSS